MLATCLAACSMWLSAAPGGGADGGAPDRGPPRTRSVPASPAPATRAPSVVATVLDVVELEDGSWAVLLASDDGGRVVMPIFIGAAEGLAIKLRLAHQAPPRPLTVDLLEEVLDALGAKVVRVEVDDLHAGTFLGRITLVARGKAHTLEARPSDSIALALGAKVPIHVARDVMDRAGVPAREVLRRRPVPQVPPGELPKTESL